MIVAVRRLLLAALVLLAPALAAAQTYTISPPPFLLAQNNSGAIINNACIWTYTAGTTTPATTYTTSTGVANTNPIRSDSAGRFTAFLAPGSSYKFVYESACTPPAHGTVLRTADNISATPASAASVDVTGTAGESITAGQCVYLSAGDGGKTPTQWYKCDSANTYSSTTNDVGIATVNIASAGAGTIRTAGSVSGLTVSGGLKYYVGTAGALTSTAPANARLLGQADSATTLALFGNPTPLMTTAGTLGQIIASAGAGVANPTWQAQGFFNDFRLSLTTATCVPTADVTGASAVTLYLTPCTGNRITLFDTSGNTETCTTAEISIAVPATTSTMYDVWAYDSTFGTCTVTLELLAWTNDSTRATATTRTNGRYVKSGTVTRLFVGSMRTTTVSGQTEDSLANRLVSNQYNRAPRALGKQIATASWTYDTATIRQANASTANQIAFVLGQAEEAVAATYLTPRVETSASASTTVYAGLGLDSTTAFTENWNFIIGTTGVGFSAGGEGFVGLSQTPAVGYHYLAMLEKGSGTSVTTTWFGSGTYAGDAKLTGVIWN